jgi:hypothetical protein
MKLDITRCRDYEELEQLNLSLPVSSTTYSDLKRCNLIFALYQFLEYSNLDKAKQHFYACGLLDAFRVQKFQNRIFDYDIHSIGYAMLSDNLPFVREEYANLTYRSVYYDDDTNLPVPISMEENVLAGEAAIFVHTIQQFLKGETALVERNLNIMETVYLKKNAVHLESEKFELDFFKALYARDRAKCEEALSALVSPKIHRARNDDSLLKKYISMPALGYAKLAWICGVEVDVKSKLIPKELLPVIPNPSYEVPYEFLK